MNKYKELEEKNNYLKEEVKYLEDRVERVLVRNRELSSRLKIKEIESDVFNNLCNSYNALINKMMDFIKEQGK